MGVTFARGPWVGRPEWPTVLEVKRLAGVCNCCGRCCTGTWNGRPFRCEHLVVSREIGTPQATYCDIYDKRFDGMPVMIRDAKTDEVITLGACWKDSDEEMAVVISRGIGRGCSLVLVDRERA